MTYALSLVDVISIFAAGLVLASFALPRRIWLCSLAVVCNIVFIGYGLYLGLLPVWLLHMVVLGLQVLRFDLGGVRHPGLPAKNAVHDWRSFG